MPVDFKDHFWGEKNNGFDVLYHNMKFGLIASKELADYFREIVTFEENSSKHFAKLAKQAGSGTIQGTFGPVWQILKCSSEKLATVHGQMMQKLQELVKDVIKYSEELHKKHKTIKEEEAGTLEVVQLIQVITTSLQKAKDIYSQKNQEYDRIKKENASAKELEKAEIKLKKAQEDYKTLVEKYNLVKEDFEKKMTTACKHFQDVEVTHLKQMKAFLNTYTQELQNSHDLIEQVHLEFKSECVNTTVDKLLQQFVESKYTGIHKPEAIEFEELTMSPVNSIEEKNTTNGEKSTTTTTTTATTTIKKEGNSDGDRQKQSKPSRRTTSLLNLFISNSQGSKEEKESSSSITTSAPTSPSSANGNSTSLVRNTLRGTQKESSSPPRSPYSSLSTWTTDGNKIAGFLKSRREKRKEKKAKKKKESLDSSSNKEDKSDTEDKDDLSRKSPEVDDEGYSVRPTVDSWDNDKASFYSTSDSDSDDRERKLHVEIKPAVNGAAPISASVDELRATVENMTLSSPVGIISGRRSSTAETDQMKRSQSVSQQLSGKPSSDLLGLNLFQSSVASTPTGPTAHPYTPLQSPPVMSSPTQLGGAISRISPSLSPKPDQRSDTRYGDSHWCSPLELTDAFSESGEMQPALPPKQRQSTAPSSIVIPRPPSRRSGEMIPGTNPRGRVSPSSTVISRADSIGSLEFRSSGVPVGTSRGPSPLTIGMADTIPLAVAFHEIIHTYFRGTDETRCQVKMSGDMMLSFPAGIVSVLTNNPSPSQLTFKIRNCSRIENILPNRQLVSMDAMLSTSDTVVYDFNMLALTGLLRRQAEQNPSASYFNVDILKYQIKTKSGASSCPFQLVAYWKCEKAHTDLRIDYKYNSHAMSSPSPLLNLTIAVPVEGGVTNMNSKPNGQWNAENNRALWKFTELSLHSENHGIGSLRARFELAHGPGTQGTIASQFNCEGTTLSGAEFELLGSGYRLSLVKRRFVSGKYLCDGDTDLRYRYAAPPGGGDC